MKMINPMQPVIDGAIEALKAVLHQSSAIKLKEIDILTRGPHRKADVKADLVAHVEVCGHRHTLVCRVMESDDPQLARESLVKFRDHAVRLADDAMPVFIASRYSADALALCREIHVGLVDMEGNARIELGEVFIARHMSPLAATHRSTVATPQTSHRTLRPRLAPERAEVIPAAQGAVA